jgi:zinc protease
MNFSILIKVPLILLFVLTLPLWSQEDPGKLKFPELTFTPSQPRYKKIMKGIDLYYQENHEAPAIKIDFIIPSGSINEPAGKEGLASLTFSLLRNGGTRKYNTEWIDERLDFLGSRITVALAAEYSQISLWCLRKNFVQTWELLEDMVLYPVFDEKWLNKLKISTQNYIRQQWNNPNSVGFLILNDLIYGKNAYNNRRSGIPSIQSITRDDVVLFYKTYIRNTGIKIAISGDFVPAEFISILKRMFKKWEVTPGKKINIPAVTLAAKPGIYFIHRGKMPHAAIFMGHLGINRLDPDKAEINVLNYIYGQDVFNSRLGKELRSNRGIVYNIYGAVGKGSPQGVFITFFKTANESVGDAISAAKNIMKDLTQNLIPAEELNAALNYAENSFVHYFENSHEIILWKIIYKLWEYPENYLETYLQYIRAIDQQKILSMAQRTIHPDQLIILVIGNKDTIYKPLTQLNMGPITELKVIIKSCEWHFKK